MHKSATKAAKRAALAIAMSLLATVILLADELAQHSPGDSDVVLVLPTRRTADAPPGPPPSLAAAADRVTPLTLKIIVSRQGPSGRIQQLRQTVSRTADRVHVTSGTDREWLFERNIRDPRRVSAFLVHHPARAIVLYAESDLRNMMGIRGWADVLSLGFDMHLLRDYKRTEQSRMIDNIRFVRYGNERRGVWWSESELLPSGFMIGDSRGSIERVSTGVDVTLFQAPTARFATYRVYDFAGWLEHH